MADGWRPQLQATRGACGDAQESLWHGTQLSLWWVIQVRGCKTDHVPFITWPQKSRTITSVVIHQSHRPGWERTTQEQECQEVGIIWGHLGSWQPHWGWRKKLRKTQQDVKDSLAREIRLPPGKRSGSDLVASPGTLNGPLISFKTHCLQKMCPVRKIFPSFTWFPDYLPHVRQRVKTSLRLAVSHLTVL